jgi:hypothetical protein
MASSLYFFDATTADVMLGSAFNTINDLKLFLVLILGIFIGFWIIEAIIKGIYNRKVKT